MAEITLERITENDIPALQQIAKPTWEATYLPILTPEQVAFMYREIYSTQALKNQMEAAQEFFFILEDNLPVGFLSLSLLNVAEERYKLNKLYLLPENQGTGAGRKALELAMSYVKDQNGKVLELNVNRYNAAQKFYARCGFTIVKEVDIPIGEFWMNDYVMERTLD